MSIEELLNFCIDHNIQFLVRTNLLTDETRLSNMKYLVHVFIQPYLMIYKAYGNNLGILLMEAKEEIDKYLKEIGEC